MKKLSIVILSIQMVIACNKNQNSGSTPNTETPTPIDSSYYKTADDTVWATLSTPVGIELWLDYSYKCKIIWGDGLLDNFYPANNDTKGTIKIKHNYSTSSNLTNLRITSKALTSVSQFINSGIGLIESFDFSKNPSVSKIVVNAKKINVSNCINLDELRCGGGIDTLNISTNKKLTILYCSGNSIRNLDVNSDTLLRLLYCNYNNLKFLSTVKLNKLRVLECTNNKLDSIKLSDKNYELISLDCSNNNLSATALNSIFNSLHNRGGSIYIKNNPGTATCNLMIANNKGWTVYTK